MSGKPFDRMVLNPRERPLSSDINQAQSQLDRGLRDYLTLMLAARFSNSSDTPIPRSGLIATSLKVVPKSPATTTVTVSAGLGFHAIPSDVPSTINGIVGLDDLCQYKPLYLSAAKDIALSASPALGFERYDIIEVKASRLVAEPTSRDVLDLGTEVFVPTLVDKNMTFDLVNQYGTVNAPSDSTAGLSYKVGVVQAVGTGIVAGTPATTSGYIRLAVIYVGPGATAIDADSIVDYRPLLLPGGVGEISATWTMPSTGVALAPTLVELVAPPGIHVVIRGRVNTAAICDVYVFAGNGPAGLVPSVQAEDSSSVESMIAKAYSAATSTVDLTLQGILADATKCAPAYTAAIGQPYAAFEVKCVRQNGGTTDTTITDPLKYYARATVRL